ncbi:MAG: phosphoribosylanthranilate isomerase [Nitrosomonadales bacterium]|jgi:phosphoribosylanthranilate isomerase|uniref:N-(5'-phosphoribosyl)anthranilate isomerase n=1 Tax=Methylophilales bacterium HTCC2181 TaxID=383631 RepID=A0P6I5_9PROT|nr:Phosphoribosylanthranilate isomerase [Methylophilales bacterium HTCC2181]MBT3513550.1 phosphoribosylanthranilate isomerase [Nitrosomonadales bacterium]MBT5411001.1 phosphoribosylanthranilate isomerase [Nitrosomonadales bacterium]MBT6140590.1 phosphoribosylanthranilate isomerase [Nitrosomonadales bacterium]|tara:strand:+ start:970 stop:1593 length:624 start_codon:yes stop_codon:yes gene_type:complete
MTIKIKICGITNIEDALNASLLGADALGFVFVGKSPRYITPLNTSIIIDALPPFISKVGLFVNPSKEEVEDAIRVAKFDLLQFHGDENEEFCNQFNLPYIKAISVKSEVNLVEYETNYNSASALLLDTYSEKARGGTGTTFDWNLIPAEESKPLIIAGGLNNENITDLLRHTTPYAVDVSGGVEVLKGKKDYKKMENFILGVRNATL